MSGSDLTIREVASRWDLNQFIALPWRIYQDDPCWVPPLVVDVKEFLNPRKHPFYQHGAAVPLLALRGRTPVGRVLVSDDPRYNEQHNTNVGFFGMFECIDDEETAGLLLDTASRWLRARGRTSVMGPIDYSFNYPIGLLIEGFDTPPRVMMNHHRPYYARLLESWGLAKLKDLYAWWFVDPHDMVDRWRRLAGWLAARGQVEIRPFRQGEFKAEVQRCKDVYDQGHQTNWGIVRLTDAEFQYFARRLAKVGIAEQVLLAEVDGRPVGFSVTIPDLNEAIRPLNGRLTTFGLPIGLVRLMYRIRHIKTARMMVLVVLEEYRRRGVAEQLILKTLDYGKNVIGYTGAELGWTVEDNYLISRTVESVGAKRYKTYRIYEKSLADSMERRTSHDVPVAGQ